MVIDQRLEPEHQDCSSLERHRLERNLRLPRHFQREVGKQVAVRLTNVVNGERRLSGLLVAASETDFTVRLESGDERVIPIDQVDRARTVFVWEAAPKPGSGGKKGARGKSSGSGPRSRADSAATTADLSADNDPDLDDPDFDDPDFDDPDIHDDQEHSES